MTPKKTKVATAQVLEPLEAQPEHKLSLQAHLMCGWPLFLVAIGGLVGGLLGGAAYGINLTIYKSQLPTYGKIALNIGAGLMAVILWLLIVLAIQSQVQ
jgi:hypothetical protein